ncbi:MAG: hydroxyacid dehydrogenase [Alkalibacterium sp.]|uniref:hydroxyacid dehydrogenase n=2 Tax=Carnobacteriaceae TaxID=186828 RepID=UPI000EE4D420|nr:hydroxyacid dehydrogenase [Alkalibacterium sp.]HAJ69983.1 glycerate dehydrogenase [Alkalibacterium sp.]
MDDVFTHRVYPDYLIKELKEDLEFVSKPLTNDELLKNLDILSEVDFIFSGWGGPKFEKDVLDAAPNLKMVFYGAGTIKNIVTNTFWEKGIRITTANAANAIAVSEYTLAAIIFGLKNALTMNQQLNDTKTYPEPGKRNIRGAFKVKIGLISLGAIARELLKLFENFDFEVIAYDPFITQEEADRLGVVLVDLDTLFKESDVVSLHTPLLDSTRGMIRKKHFLSMKGNTTFINTARGAVVNEEEMIEALRERKDISAYLDVVYPEPPKKSSPLYEMKNVFLTPHIAGSEGNEVTRMGDLMVKEFKAYLAGEKLKYEVNKEDYERMA